MIIIENFVSRTYAKSPKVKLERAPYRRNFADITGAQL